MLDAAELEGLTDTATATACRLPVKENLQHSSSAMCSAVRSAMRLGLSGAARKAQSSNGLLIVTETDAARDPAQP